jgi:hypothetical protein
LILSNIVDLIITFSRILEFSSQQTTVLILDNACQPQISGLNTYWETYERERVVKTFTVMNVMNFRHIETTASSPPNGRPQTQNKY